MKIYNLTVINSTTKQYIIDDYIGEIPNDILESIKDNFPYNYINENNENGSRLVYYITDRYINDLHEENHVYTEYIRFKRNKNINVILE